MGIGARIIVGALSYGYAISSIKGAPGSSRCNITKPDRYGTFVPVRILKIESHCEKFGGFCF